MGVALHAYDKCKTRPESFGSEMHRHLSSGDQGSNQPHSSAHQAATMKYIPCSEAIIFHQKLSEVLLAATSEPLRSEASWACAQSVAAPPEHSERLNAGC